VARESRRQRAALAMARSAAGRESAQSPSHHWHWRLSINGQSVEQRRAARQELSAPLVADLERWLREQRSKLSRGNDVAKAMDYMLKRWPAFTRFLDDRRICLSNNAAEGALRRVARGTGHPRCIELRHRLDTSAGIPLLRKRD